MEKKIDEWSYAVKQAGCIIKSIDLLNEIRKKDGSLLFALIDAKVESPEGTMLPNIVFIRGHASVIVPRIENAATGEQLFLMVRQRRIGSGSYSLEFPAGMLDEHSEFPALIAAKELSEETTLQLSSDILFPLHDKMLYSSVGGSDEGIYYFGCIVKVSDAQFRGFHKRSAGNADENEQISIELVTRVAAEIECCCMQVPLGFYLFDKYVKEHGETAYIIS